MGQVGAWEKPGHPEGDWNLGIFGILLTVAVHSTE